MPGDGSGFETNDELKLVIQLAAVPDRAEVWATSRFGEAHGETPLPSPALLDQIAACDPANIPPVVLATVGRALYSTLTAGDVGKLSSDLLAEGAKRGRPVQLELRFDPDQVVLAQFPWEMMADENGRYLLREGVVNLSRYITYPQPPPPIDATVQALPFLQVISQPSDLDTLSITTPPLDHLETIAHASFAALTQKLLVERAGLWGLQFDGHGFVAPRCGKCGRLNAPDWPLCAGCGAPLAGAARIGALAFEKEGRADLISTDEFGSVVYNAGVRIAVLLACESARVGSGLIFSGLAPGLVLSGVPAVIGMQYPILDTFAAAFSATFYRRLLQTNDVLDALATARRSSLRDAWYSPVLYLRRQPSALPSAPTSTFQDRKIDTAVPATVKPAADFLVRLWIRRPTTAPLSEAQLRAQLDIAPETPVLSAEDEGEIEFKPVPGRQFRRGEVVVSLTAPTCQVTPGEVKLFVDERLDAPPAIFAVRAFKTGRAPLIFGVSQDGGQLATIVHTVQVVEGTGEEKVQTASHTLTKKAEAPGSIAVTGSGGTSEQPTGTRRCPYCGAENGSALSYCPVCGRSLMGTFVPPRPPPWVPPPSGSYPDYPVNQPAAPPLPETAPAWPRENNPTDGAPPSGFPQPAAPPRAQGCLSGCFPTILVILVALLSAMLVVSVHPLLMFLSTLPMISR